MTDEAFDEIHGGDDFFNLRVIIVFVVMKSDERAIYLSILEVPMAGRPR